MQRAIEAVITEYPEPWDYYSLNQPEMAGFYQYTKPLI